MKITTRHFLLLLALPLAGCSYLGSTTSASDSAYMSARSIPPLRTPPGVSSSAFHNEYPVSDRTYPPKALKVSVTPPGL